MWKRLQELLAAYQEKDPAAHSKLEIFLLYPGVHALICHRIAHWFYKRNRRFLARWISEGAKRRTGIDIHPGAQIGRRLVIDHGTGLVIGETAILGNDILLYQGVTLGGSGKDVGKRHPTLEDHVTVGAGAKVLGSFTVGQGARIGRQCGGAFPGTPGCYRRRGARPGGAGGRPSGGRSGSYPHPRPHYAGVVPDQPPHRRASPRMKQNVHNAIASCY